MSHLSRIGEYDMKSANDMQALQAIVEVISKTNKAIGHERFVVVQITNGETHVIEATLFDKGDK